MILFSWTLVIALNKSDWFVILGIHNLGYCTSKVFHTHQFTPAKLTVTLLGSNSIDGGKISVAAHDQLAVCLVKMLKAEYANGKSPLSTTSQPVMQWSSNDCIPEG